jgi:hypothetical protein
MAIPTYTFTGTARAPSAGIITGKGDANSLKKLGASTIELTAGATGRTFKVCTIPSSARISGLSKVYNDDCATTGAPIMDFGLTGLSVTADPDAIGNGLATLATATTSMAGYAVVSDPVSIGKPAWSLINGVTTDPGGVLDVYGTQTDAATTQTGTVTVEIFGYLD